MEKVKKPFYKKWWFWTIIVVVIIGALAGQGGKNASTVNAPSDATTAAGESTAVSSDSKNSPADKSEPVKEVNPKQKIEFKNVISKNNLGMTMVYGEAQNNDDSAHSFTVKVSFYDKDKKLLGTAAGVVNDLNGGESKIFSATGTEDYSKADNYKVQVDTLVSSTKNKEIPIEFTNVVLKDNLGLTTVEGEAKNNDTSAHSFTVMAGLYDANNKLLGVAAGAINDLASGDTMTFTAMGADGIKGVKNTKIQVDTLVN